MLAFLLFAGFALIVVGTLTFSRGRDHVMMFGLFLILAGLLCLGIAHTIHNDRRAYAPTRFTPQGPQGPAATSFYTQVATLA